MLALYSKLVSHHTILTTQWGNWEQACNILEMECEKGNISGLWF